MSFEMNRLLRYQPEPELTQQEIKDLKDGVPNYPMPEFEGPEPSLEHLCCECTGSGVMIGNYPCKVCRGTGYVVPIADADIYLEPVQWPDNVLEVMGEVPEPEYKPITQGAIQVAIDILDQFERKKNRALMDLVITGSTIVRKPPLEDIKNAWQKLVEVYKTGTQDVEAWRKSFGYVTTKPLNTPYPNERELSLLNTRITKLKAQLSKELQKKKAERSQFEINQIQQSINTLTKWKLPSKNSTQTGC